MREIIVVKNGNDDATMDSNGTWKITSDENKEVIARFETEQEAINHAKKISVNSRSELIVHKRDGTVCWKDSNEFGFYPIPG